MVCSCACLHYLLGYLMKQVGSWSPITVYGNTAATKQCFKFHKIWLFLKKKKQTGRGSWCCQYRTYRSIKWIASGIYMSPIKQNFIGWNKKNSCRTVRSSLKCIKKITHMWRSWGTPQNFFSAFIDELEKQIIKKSVEVAQ